MEFLVGFDRSKRRWASRSTSATPTTGTGASSRSPEGPSRARNQRQAARRNERRLADGDGRRHGDRGHPIHAANRRRDVLYVRARGVRHGSAQVLARLARGEEVDASEYTFRTATQIETAATELDWLNKGVFVSVGGRQLGGVVYETYLVE